MLPCRLREFSLIPNDQSGEVCSARLPTGGHATPMTYFVNGKQYVVIAAGGHAKISQEPQSDALVAFTLP